MEAVLFPSVEVALIAFLNAQFTARGDSAKAGNTVPKDRGRFVAVTRVGGARSTPAHDDAMVTFECWDTSAARASSLAMLTRALVGSLDGETRYVSEVGGPASFPDPRTDLPRYQFTAVIRSRGEAL